MKKVIFYTLTLLFFQTAYTQSQPYYLEVLNDTYVNLDNSTSLNNAEIWDDPNYAVPIGFDFEFFGAAYDTLYISGLGGVVFFDTLTLNDYPLLIAYGSDIIDRGEVSGTSQSKISYKTTGVAGSRILKVEWKNAGFYNEIDNTGQSNSFVNLQLWLYESSSAFEIRFGSSLIANNALAHDGFDGPTIGFVDSLLQDGDSFRRFYYLAGKAEAPVLKKVNSEVDIDTITTYLVGNPLDGLVYRFSDLPVAASEPAIQDVDYQLFPTVAGNYLTIEKKRDLLPDNLYYIIFSTDGKVVRPNKPLQHTQVSLDDLPRGYYYIQLIEPGGRQTNFPFIKG